MTTQLTLGVIGHVDHGKTALVRALTGIETDRLKEEQERGLSIELGFSYLEPGGGVIDLIDVPGHEDFIRTMVAGASGVDGVLLIVAANERVMPQTREHFDIARMLGVKLGLIVLSKVDLVSAEEIEAAEQEIRDFVAGTFLQDAPMIRTSSTTGEGINLLRGVVEKMSGRETAPPSSDGFFLPIDRVFAMQGFGIVATGTLRHGALSINDTVEALPSGQIVAVRGLQSHGKPTDAAYAGERVAVNLRNVKREDLKRGDVLASPGLLRATRRIDVELELLPDRKNALKNGTAIRVMFGTTEAVAKVRLLDQQVLEPGAIGLVQLRFQREVATHRTERIIIRRLSPAQTLGGGRILDANPPRHRRFDEAVTAQLSSVSGGNPNDMVRASLAEAGTRGLDANALRRRLGISSATMAAAIEAIGAVSVGESWLLERSKYEALIAGIASAVERYHTEHPREPGLATASLSNYARANADEAVLQAAVAELVADGRLENDAGLLRLAGFDPLASLPAADRRLATEIEQIYLSDGLVSRPIDAVLGRDATKRDLFRSLTQSGVLVRLKTYDRSSSLVLHRSTLRDVKRKLEEAFPYPTPFTVAQVRDLVAASRKYVVPLLEHLDATGVTIRSDDVRRLRQR